MYQEYFRRLIRLLEEDIPRSLVLTELGVTDPNVAEDDEAACHALCNATVAPGPMLGLCHARCGMLEAQRSMDRTSRSDSEEACHAHCNATVPPGPALGACHIRCALGA